MTVIQRLREVIPGGVNSPIRSFREIGQDPIIIKSAKGSHLYDENDKKYLDFCCSFGAIILGHADEKILQPVFERMQLGTTFGASCEIEEKLARKIVDHLPSIEKVRFVSSGTEATLSAVRLARGYTGREKIVKFDGNYHGHADCFLVKPGSYAQASTKGVPASAVQDTVSLPFNDSEALRTYLRKHEVAAVILEPIAGNMGLVPATEEFLQTAREETETTGALLIFDEVITGFRVGLQGAQGLYQIRPDLTTLGKVIGGGFPVGAFGGRSEIMDHLAPSGGVFQAGTLSGNPVAMEAGYQTLCRIEAPGFFEELKRKTTLLLEGLPLDIPRIASLFAIAPKNFPKFYQSLLNKGIYAPPSKMETWFMTDSHTDEELNFANQTLRQLLRD